MLAFEVGHHLGVGPRFRIAEKPGLAFGQHLPIDGIDLCFLGAFPGSAGAAALAFHLGVETLVVDGEAKLARHLFHFVQRQTVGVVHLEGGAAGNDAVLRGLYFVLKNLFGHLERGGIAMLFILDDARHAWHGLEQFRIGRLHPFGHEPGELIKIGIGLAGAPRVAHGAPHDLAQHKAAAVVGRHHAVVNQEGSGASVVSRNAQRGVFPRVCAGRDMKKFAGAGDDRRQQIAFVVGELALQDRRDAFQAHPGVDRRLGQARHDAVGGAVELHENQVPDFDEAPAAIQRKLLALAARFGGVGAKVVVNFRARPTGSGVAHLPEVIFFIEPEDARLGHAGNLLP